MNSKIIYIILLWAVFSCSDTGEINEKVNIVENYIEARNQYDFYLAKKLLAKDYKEVFIDKSSELEKREQLKDIFAWDSIMNAKTILKEIKEKDGKVVTTEVFTNYMDVALEKSSRTFIITYEIKNGKIQQSLIDSTDGYSKIDTESRLKYSLFKTYCEEQNITLNPNVNAEGAVVLKRALNQYNHK